MNVLWIFAALVFAGASAAAWRLVRAEAVRRVIALPVLFAGAALACGLTALRGTSDAVLDLWLAVLVCAVALAGVATLLSLRTLFEHAALARAKATALEEELERFVTESSSHLEASVARFRALAEVAPIGILECDARGRCTYVSERWSEWTGRARESALGDGWLEALEGGDRPRVEAEWKAALAAGLPYQGEFALQDGAGSPRRLLCQLVPRALAGEPGYVGTLTDVSERHAAEEERRRLEARLQHAQKLESLGVLAGGLAHDFNNLLVGILGNVHVLQSRCAGEKEVELYLARVQTAALRAADLARDMLRYAGRGSVELELVDLSAVVAEMVPLLEVSLPPRTSVSCSLDENLPALEADPTQLRQLVLNLMTNALEACAETGGRVEVRTARARSAGLSAAESNTGAAFPAGDALMLEVVDTGSGMDAETIARMFDPFFTTKPRGRGLGLAVVLGVVRKLRGALQVRSAPEEGTSIRVLFSGSENRPVTLEASELAAEEL